MTEIFVFGSNLAGRHGKGAALAARHEYGAVYGVGEGRTGNSYAIPTKDKSIRTLPLGIIAGHIADFLQYAGDNSELRFKLTPIGCGLAGYRPEQIGPFFRFSPINVIIPPEFEPFI